MTKSLVKDSGLFWDGLHVKNQPSKEVVSGPNGQTVVVDMKVEVPAGRQSEIPKPSSDENVE